MGWGLALLVLACGDPSAYRSAWLERLLWQGSYEECLAVFESLDEGERSEARVRSSAVLAGLGTLGIDPDLAHHLSATLIAGKRPSVGQPVLERGALEFLADLAASAATSSDDDSTLAIIGGAWWWAALYLADMDTRGAAGARGSVDGPPLKSVRWPTCQRLKDALVYLSKHRQSTPAGSLGATLAESASRSLEEIRAGQGDLREQVDAWLETVPRAGSAAPGAVDR